MSIYSVWIKCQDGKWYEDPVWTVPDKWFICLDDDDPPELVIAEDEISKGTLAALELDWIKIGKKTWRSGGSRYYPPYGKHGAPDRPSIMSRSYNGIILKIPPVPDFYDAVAESKDDSRIQCWYDIKS